MHVENYKYSPLCTLRLHIKPSSSMFYKLSRFKAHLFSKIIIHRHLVGMYIMFFVFFFQYLAMNNVIYSTCSCSETPSSEKTNEC